VEIGTEEFCDEVDIFERGDENVGTVCHIYSHILQGGDEDIAKGDDLQESVFSPGTTLQPLPHPPLAVPIPCSPVGSSPLIPWPFSPITD